MDPMNGTPTSTPTRAAEKWFGKALAEASAVERRVLDVALHQKTVAKDAALQADAQRSFGERMADAVAAFGGSWTFIGLFALVIVLWSLVNTELLGTAAFDPYPYIFLNLMLSMLAAVQAPVILMSQNRQAERDRIAAAHDYEVNLRAELGIIALHEKLDALRIDQMATLIATQQEQIALLQRLVEARAPDGR